MTINSKRMIMAARGALLIASIMTAGCLDPITHGASLDEGEGRREDLVTTSPYAYPYGPPTLVNTYPIGSAYAITTAASTNGDVIVLWRVGSGFPNNGYIQRYDAAGRKLQAQDLDLGAGAADVAAGPSGTYAILSQRPENGAYGLYVTVYNRSGGVMVLPLRVNDSSSQTQPYAAASIAMNASGQFVVAWATTSASVPNYIYARAFSAAGGSMGPQVLVSSVTTSLQRIGAVNVALNSTANFVVSWSSGNLYDQPYADVWARRYSPAGVALGAVFQVNTTTDGNQEGAAITMNEAGQSIIVWNARQASGGQALFGRRFDAVGSPLGGEFQINATAASMYYGYDVAMAPNGSFVVTWNDPAVGPVLSQVMARGYNSAGAPLGTALQVSSATDDWPEFAAVAMDPTGNHTIVWLQTIAGTQKVYTQRISPSGAVLQSIASGQAIGSLAGAAGSWQYFKLTVPPGKGTVDITISGGSGDADLYVRWGVLPTFTAWDGRPWLTGNTEGVRMLGFPAGDWYIGINGYAAYNSLSLGAVAY